MFSNPFVKRNLSIAWPLALNALLMQSMLMIDTLLVSPLGEIPLAAMGIATTIVAFILGIQMALANGTQLVISRAVGSQVTASITQAFWAGMLINSFVAVSFWLLLTFFDQDLIAHITDNPALYPLVQDYLSISCYLLIFNAITQIITALFNALGKTKIPFKGYLIEMPLNTLISYGLIHGVAGVEGIGVKGAAIGTLIAIIIRLFYLSYSLYLQPKFSLTLSHSMTELLIHCRHHFIEIFPVAANVTILSIGATIYQLLFSQLQLNAYVAITLIMPWIRSGTQFITAWAHSSAITISQAIGSGKLEHLTQQVNISIKIAVMISAMTSCFFAGVSLFIQHVYPDLDASTYHALAAIAPLYILLPIVRGFNTVHGHVLRALGQTTAVFKINFTGQWIISLPLCALLILYFDVSIFWAFAIHPFEEIIKAFPFHHLARRSLNHYASHPDILRQLKSPAG